MRIGLIDVDGHNYPNLPLMKISAWHKQQGDSVEWYQPHANSAWYRVAIIDCLKVIDTYRERLRNG